ncbi:MAG: anaerobic sulfatase maturase [Acidimicrobiia bacterium]
MTTLPRDAPPAFHLMAKPSGAVCNLDCSYCFYLSKELLYPGARFRMADDVLRAWIRQTIEGHRTPEVDLAFQGGEPTLLGLGFFRRAVAYAREYAGDRQLQLTMQTNGTLVDAEWARFLHDEGFLVGLSIDGPPAMHDRYRVDKQGRPTSGRVRAAWDLLQAHGVDTNVLCTVNAANADHPLDVYRYFRDELGARYIQLIPIVERAAGGPEDLVTDRTVRAEQWGAFLTAVFDEWVQRDVGSVFVPTFDAALASWLGVPRGMCIFEPTCGNALALEHNGDVYSCDHFVEPEHLLGNIMTTHVVELVASPQQRAFGRAKADSLPRYCRDCDVRFACNGECPKNRFLSTPDGEAGLNYLCAGYKAFFGHVDRPMRMMAELLRSGRFADEVMALLAAERG